MQTSESPARDMLRLVVWYPLRWLLLGLPPDLGLALLRRMGDLHRAVAGTKQRLLAENLQRIGIAPERHQAAIRTYFQLHYIDQLFILLFPRLCRDNITNILELRGLAHLDAARERGRGVILVHGHLGPVHLPLVGLALRGYPMRQIGNPSDRGLSWIGRHVAFRLRQRYEQRIPAKIISAGSFLRPIFKILKENGVVMTTGDGSGNAMLFGRQHLFSFLGQPVLMPLGPATLARKTGAALLPLFIEPGTTSPFVATIEAEIVSHTQGEEGIREDTERFVRRLEDYIRRQPGYMHFLDRFRPGELVHVQDH